MTINMPQHARTIIDTLSSHGYQAYIVGGCVRDAVLSKTPSDWDITTSARPEVVKRLFPRTIDTGLKHGTVTVMLDKEAYEVTTFRVDGDYDDHRHPTEVSFTTSLEEDLKRRDFTINAMAYNDRDGLVDLFGGREDLSRGLIRCVGRAEDRFGEDALRMLRAVRFAGQLGFTIEKDSEEAIKKMHKLLSNVSAERIQMELLKLMISDHPEMFRLAWETGLTSVFFPEFDQMMETSQNNPHHMYNVGEHTLLALTFTENNPVLRLALLLHDVGKPFTKTTDEEGIDHFYGHNEVSAAISQKILKRLKFDNQTIKIVTKLLTYHDTRFNNALTTGRKHVRRIINKVGVPLFPYLLDIMEADVKAQSPYMREEKLSRLQETREAYELILKEEDCITLKDLAINGNDLKELGIAEGKVIGAILQALLDIVLENPKRNDPAYLKQVAAGIYRELTQ